jgi:hypothetical protein
VCSKEKEKLKLVTLLNTILEQNYLQFNDQFYKKKKCQEMGATTSATVAETFTQFLEHTKDNLQCWTKTQTQHRILHLTTREF